MKLFSASIQNFFEGFASFYTSIYKEPEFGEGNMSDRFKWSVQFRLLAELLLCFPNGLKHRNLDAAAGWDLGFMKIRYKVSGSGAKFFY